nr:MAG TPA: hypothetical protein [Caudoviricetes sp.]
MATASVRLSSIGKKVLNNPFYYTHFIKKGV